MHLSKARGLLRQIVPAQTRTSLSKELARRSYEHFLSQTFESAFAPADPGPPPPPDVIMKTNAKTKIAFDEAHRRQAVGANIYMTTGYNAAHIILRRLIEDGFDPGQLKTVFELGCGDGRILRHFRSLKNLKLIGSDTRAETVEWCKEHLPGPDYFVNGFEPSLPFLGDDAVDLAYAFSVFTHIPLATQKPWLEEMCRVIRPGGYFLVTVMGKSLKESLSQKRQNELNERGELEITGDDEDAHLATQVGGSRWDVYQSRKRIEEVFGSVFELRAYLEDGLNPHAAGWREPPPLGQDLLVLRKKTAN